MIQDTVRRFAEDEVLPGEVDRDAEGTFPAELIAELAEQGMLGLPIPEEYDGADMGLLCTALAVEELARASGSLALTVSAHIALGAGVILQLGDDAQKSELLPALARGERLGSFGITEDGAGSDALAVATRARRDGEHWVLDGAKNWVTNGGPDGLVVVIARTSDGDHGAGLSAFAIDGKTAGLTWGDKIATMGVRSAMSRALTLTECRVPASRLLGAEGEAFTGVRAVLDRGRVVIGSLAVGLAEGAFQRALRYATERVAFGKPIAKQQAISFYLADMATQITAARHLVHHAARLADAGRPFSRDASMAKLFATELAVKVGSSAIQVHGGYGYTTEYHVERAYRDARLFPIGEGTSEVQRLLIARDLLAQVDGAES